MSDNPLKDIGKGGGKRGCPPDMPRGDSDEDKVARQAYWIRVGNEKLWEAGKTHLEWKASNGHYWIAERGA